ncbi:two-component system response regulator [Pleurocapsa sp. PCC 7319]|uniref:response regulator n=1 Tax=Pleurocapsa sp. PCC 7319 TaxID=118161 RepID=UPI00036C84CB|nr:response regulator [Pleurocapsa sp. PCC 7319]
MTILIATHNRGQKRLGANSRILALYDQVYIYSKKTTTILSWIQQHQPDLVVLDFEISQIKKMELISVLRLDWLTRNIPIIIITNLASQQKLATTNLDFNACLVEPYSLQELERVICSLVPIPDCELSVSAS